MDGTIRRQAMDKQRMREIAEMMRQGKTAADLGPVVPLTPAQMVARMSDSQVREIFAQEIWEQGDEVARAACLAEFDKRFGLENWPTHIDRSLR